MTDADESAPATPRSDFGELESTFVGKGQYLLFEEAVCWIAFRSFDFPGLGPAPLYRFHRSTSSDEWDAALQQGRHDLARDQLVAAILTEAIALYGVLEKVKETELHKDDQAWFNNRPHKLSVKGVSPEGFERSDSLYDIGGTRYETLIVSCDDLLHVFGGLALGDLPTGSETLEQVDNVQAAPQFPELEPRRRGRRRQWNWDIVFTEIAVIANTPDGLPQTQAELERMVAAYCLNTFGREPAASTIRDKVAPIYELLRRKSR